MGYKQMQGSRSQAILKPLTAQTMERNSEAIPNLHQMKQDKPKTKVQKRRERRRSQLKYQRKVPPHVNA
jgi:hypothetical protein